MMYQPNTPQHPSQGMTDHVRIFVAGMLVGMLLIIGITIFTAPEPDHDSHGVPCTISEECK